MTYRMTRKEAIDVLKAYLMFDKSSQQVAKALDMAIEALRAPTADRPKGEWILVCDGGGDCDNLYRCSHCGQEVGCEEYDKPKFCGECGSDMRGKK